MCSAKQAKKGGNIRYGAHVCLIKLNFFLTRSGNKVLEVGCGEGAYSHALKNYGKCVVGLDRDVVSIRLGKKKYPNIIFIISDVYFLPFRAGSFDTGLAGDILEHLIDDVSALKEIRRATNNILISVPRYEIRKDPSHLRMYSKSTIQNLLSNASVKCVVLKNWFPCPKPILCIFAKLIAQLYPSGFLCEAVKT